MTPELFASCRSVGSPDRAKLPPKLMPPDVYDLITTAFARRRAAEDAHEPRRSQLGPMQELANALCTVVPELAVGAGEVLVRLCDLPGTASAATVWARVRTAARADWWEYSRDHHHCIRIGDWSGWAA